MARFHPGKQMDLQLCERKLYHVRNRYYLVIVFMLKYEDTSMCQSDKGWILIPILGFQIKI